MSWNYTPEQRDSIDKLRVAVNKLAQILDDNETSGIISNEQKKTLTGIKNRSKKILDKLDSQNFTVAIVGLENAGKSSFANALMGIYDLLPTDKFRCTYTIAEIRWGQENKGEVSFYTYEEFNEKFIGLVNQIANFNGVVDFRNLDWAQNIKPVLKPNADKNVTADVESMLNNKNHILPLLKGQTTPFKETELTTPAFQRYITGKVAGNFEGYPYAVKGITIWSARFEKMENILLYDAPGYNSTTQSHKTQSEDITKEADAVILVVSILEGAEIKSTQTAIFGKDTEGKDNCGTKFEDKTLIFGNKADLLLTDMAKENPDKNDDPKDSIEKLRVSAQENNIAKPEYVVLGSVRRYENGTPGSEYDGGNARESALLSKELGLSQEISDNGVCGVDLLFEKLTYYYQHDRTDVLIKSVRNILGEMEESIKSLTTEYNAIEADDGGRLYIDATINLYEFKYFSSEVIQSEVDTIRETKPFSKSLRKKLEENENIFQIQSDTSEALIRVKRGLDINITGIYPASDIDKPFRKSVYDIFFENIKNAVETEMTKKKSEIYKLLKDKFLEIMGMTGTSPRDEKVRKQISQNVDELFRRLWNEKNEEQSDSIGVGDFDLLLTVLILCPFKPTERLSYIEKNLDAFKALATYYAADSQTNGQAEFFAKILTQKDATGNQPLMANATTVKQALSDYFSGAIYPPTLKVQDLPLDVWAQKFMTHGIYTIPDDFKKNINPAVKRGGISNDDKIDLLNDEIENYIAQRPVVQSDESHLPTEITEEWLEKIANLEHNAIKTEKDMLRVLNNDIETLRSFAKGALVESINIERNFLSGVARNTRIIRSGMEKAHRRELFKQWVVDNLKLIKVEEFKGIDAAKLANLKRKKFAQDVEAIIKTLQN